MTHNTPNTDINPCGWYCPTTARSFQIQKQDATFRFEKNITLNWYSHPHATYKSKLHVTARQSIVCLSPLSTTWSYFIQEWYQYVDVGFTLFLHWTVTLPHKQKIVSVKLYFKFIGQLLYFISEVSILKIMSNHMSISLVSSFETLGATDEPQTKMLLFIIGVVHLWIDHFGSY